SAVSGWSLSRAVTVTSRRPPGERTTWATGAGWGRGGERALPVAAAQTWTERSSWTVASREPSGSRTTLRTGGSGRHGPPRRRPPGDPVPRLQGAVVPHDRDVPAGGVGGNQGRGFTLLPGGRQRVGGRQVPQPPGVVGDLGYPWDRQPRQLPLDEEEAAVGAE